MALPEVPKLNFSVALSMTGAFPVEANAFFKTYDEAFEAAAKAQAPGSTDTIYYYTQILHVVEGDQAGVYMIKPDNSLIKLDVESSGGEGGGGVDFTTDNTLTLKNGILSVNTTDKVEENNQLPITSAAVFETVGVIRNELEEI